MMENGNQKPPEEVPAAAWSFGAVEFDELKWQLRVRGTLVEIEPRPLEILLCLLRHAGEVVTREEVLHAVWGHSHLSENTLSNAVAKLRRALGDDDQAIIATVHRVGYRLAVPVRRRELSPSRRDSLALQPGEPVPRRPEWALLRPLGSGARSEVWLARHLERGEERVFKFSVDGFGLASLKREATLSRLLFEALPARHDLVRVLDWNFDEPPFFIEREYGGANLPEWIASQGGLVALALTVRLELMAQICEAVAAAHSVGVLHKDLKPANVLIDQQPDGDWSVRLIDFGSGGLTDPSRLAALGVTRMGFTQTIVAESRSGTPLYLAPELLLGQSPTVQSDIYALGVMLYQLVIGDLRHPLAAGWEREIDDELLRRDIGEAASGKPERRIAAAAELALRLRSLEQRHRQQRESALRRQQAEAAERALAHARARRPWLVSAVAALVLGLAASLWFFAQSIRSRDEALQQFEIAQAVNDFLNNDLLAAANPNIGGSSKVTVLEAIRRAADKIDISFSRSPQISLALHQTIGSAYRTLGDYAAAEVEFRRAQSVAETSPRPDPAAIINNELLLAQDLAYENKYDEASALIRQIEQQLQRHASRATLIPTRLWDVQALLDRHRTDVAAAAADAERSLKSLDALKRAYPQVYSANAQSAFLTRLHIAQAFQEAGRSVEAERIERALIEEIGTQRDTRDPLAIRVRQQLLDNLIDQARIGEASALLPTLMQDAQLSLGDGNPIFLNLLRADARLAAKQQHWPQAITASAEAERGYRQLLGAHNDATVQAMLDSSHILADSGRVQEALSKSLEAYTLAQAIQGQDGLLSQLLAYDLVSGYLDLDQVESARPLLQTLDLSALQSAAPLDHAWAAKLDYQRGRLALLSGESASARRYFQSALNASSGGPLRAAIEKHLAQL